MPIFTEGQDPLDQTASPPPGRMPTGQPEPEPFSGPSKNVIVGAAFRQNNPVVSVLDAITRSRPDMTPVADYNPVARLKGTENDDLIDQSLADVNPAQTDARIAKKQAERKDQQTLAASGGFGTVASIAAGALDPSWFIPIVGELHGAAELGIAARALRAGAEGAGKSAISESVLQQSQATRTAGDSASNIATNTLLMGLLGGGMAMLDRGSTAGAMAEIRQRSGLPPAAEAPPSPAPKPPPPGIDAFHGSPHDFDAFSTAKIGSGEGAQAYGHGLYFAESEGVATSYRNNLSMAELTDPREAAGYYLSKNDGDAVAAERQMRGMADGMSTPEYAKGLLEGADLLKNGVDRSSLKTPGALYKVRINADHERMLDWDRPLSEQPQALQDLVRHLGIDESRIKTGADAYRWIGQKLGPQEMNDTLGREAAASRALHEAGVPGIKYLDRGSRQAGEGTRNFVVFHEGDVQITHKNGTPIQTAAAEGLDKVREDLSPQPQAPKFPEREYNTEGYHGTNDIITRFDPKQTRLHRGVFFSDKPDLANKFAHGLGTDSDAAHFPDEPGFLDWIKPLVSEKEFAGIEKTHAKHDAAMTEMSKYDVDSPEYLAAQHEYTTLSNQLNKEAKKVSSYIDYETGEFSKSPNVTPVRLRLGRTHEVDMGGRFDWDAEREAIRFAKSNGFDSVTMKNVGEGEQKIYSIFDADNIRSRFAEKVPDHETAPPVLASDLSAAESDQRTMKLSRILLPENLVLGARNIPGVGGAIGAAYDWTAATMMRFSPTLRVFSSESLVAKRAMGDLAETALRFTQSEAGITTARGGVPIDRLVKMQTYKARMENSHILRDAFVEYRALEDKTAPIIRSQIEDVRGLAGGKMSFDDFKTEVTLAATNGDEHAIPQVQAAARMIRQKVLDPVKAMAQRTLGPDGKPMLAEELEAPKGDKSFFPRSWNKEAIAANYNGAKRVFSDWLEGEQGIKKAAQDRIAGHSRQLEMAEKRISDLEAKIEKLPEGDKARADLEYDARRAGETRDSIRGLVEKEIEAWEGDSSRAAKSALKARAKASEGRAPDMPRLRAADPEVDAAVRKILASSRDLTREELENRAAEIIHRINTAPDGRLAYEAGGGGQAVPTGAQAVRGSLNARDFAIPTSLVKDFVHTDTEHVVSGFLRSTIPDIHLTDRFGDIEMTDVFRRLNEEYDRRLAGTTSGRESTRLDNERKAMVRDLAATRDRLRGIYGFQLAQSQPNAARIANAARSYNLIADLGTSVFNRLTDSTNAVWRHGLINVFGDGYGPFLKSALGMGEGFSTSARQSMKDMGVGIDGTLGHMAHQWGDVIDNYLPGSKFERAMTWAADKSMIVNLHGPWTDAMKTVAGTVAAADFLRTAERVSLGTHTEQDIQRLAQAGIAPHMAERIWKAYSEGGGQEFGRGTHVANTADWTDTHARDVFTSAIGRDADMAVLTPGMEKPLWMSGPVVSLLGQYKSFVAAAHEKVLISNLQQMDGRTLQGLVAAMGMGMLSYRAYTLWSGAPTSDRPQDWIKEGISRSAIGGWYTELNNIQAKFTGGNTDVFRAIGADHPMSRRQSNSALSELLGPTYSKLEGIAGGLNDASHGTWTAQDTHKLRQALWLQNLFATRRLLDSVEDGFNESIGVKPMNRDAATWPGAAAR